jgi:hypothetical protein
VGCVSKMLQIFMAATSRALFGGHVIEIYNLPSSLKQCRVIIVKLDLFGDKIILRQHVVGGKVGRRKEEEIGMASITVFSREVFRHI